MEKQLEVDKKLPSWGVGRTLSVVVLVGVLTTALVIAYTFFGFGQTEKQVKRLDTAEITVIGTPGGMLEVSTLTKNEEFGWSTKHTCPFIDCGRLLKATISEIRIPVHYTYRIPLAAKWVLVRKDSYLQLTVPKVEPLLPPGVEFATMELRTNKTWTSPSVKENRESLLRNLGSELDRRAKQDHYIDAQRAQARRTVAEFAHKWMIEQGVEKTRTELPIKVVFEDDAVASPH